MIHLIDDQLLGRVLREPAPPDARTQVFTTGLWYVRLCQAVLRGADRTGTLSRPFAALSEEQRERATRGLLALPPWIGLVSLRVLAPRIGQLRSRHALNVLGMEVLAAAVELGAEVQLTSRSPRLEDALRTEGLRVALLG